jgi:protein-S-isoprenylcysteine O-methyltransferase Ste14
MWAVGGQLLLSNPVSTVLFALVVGRPRQAPPVLRRGCRGCCRRLAAQPATRSGALRWLNPGACLQAQRFFSIRIAYEEQLLREFFGDSYSHYAARTPTWMPGIR